MQTTVGRPASASETVESSLFRRQESTLVALNLLVLAGLLLVHQIFRSYLGAPSRAVLIGICGFFLLQLIELYLLQTIGEFSRSTLRLYSRASVAIKLLIGVWIAFAGDVEESHYAVLILMPVMSAAFRFSFWGVMSTAIAAGLLHFGELWMYYRAHPPVEFHEVFEAGTVVMIYLVVAVVIWSLSRQLRRERRLVEASLLDLHRTRDRLIEEEKLAAVGRLAGAVAHEIRNPVAMIKSTAELVRQGRIGEEERAEMCGILVGEGQRLEKLTTDFLSYARAKPPDPRPTPVGELLDYLASLARARTEEVGHELIVAERSEDVVQVDPFQIQQAMLNLLINALQAAPPGTPVRLGAARRDGGEPRLFVENEGDPIPAASAARLFEPFFTTKERGTGLGLAIARNIARAHGGDLVLARNEPGRVRFELVLPAPAAVVVPGAVDDPGR